MNQELSKRTEDYFENNQFSIAAFEKKYKLNDAETYPEAVWRVCKTIAAVESSDSEKEFWAKRWFNEIMNDWWHPAGSIMQGAGNGNSVSLANCTTLSLGKNLENHEWDNLESIIRNTGYSVAKSAAYRQGLGVDFSRLRPKGTKVYNSANESTGAVHWMGFIDSIANYVGQRGRIPAMLFSISCTHPDVEEFIKVKSDFTKIQNANISVQCTNDFYNAVLQDKSWELKFTIPAVNKGDKVYVDPNSSVTGCQKDENGYYYIASKTKKEEVFKKKIKASKLLDLIAQNMTNFAEPGIQNIDIAEKYSNSDYVYDPSSDFDSRVISTNAPVIGETLVPTSKGIFPIRELYEKGSSQIIVDSLTQLPREQVDWRFNKNSTLPSSSPIAVNASFNLYKDQKVWKVSLNDGEIVYCNAEHKWFVNGEMIPTKNIKPGDKLYGSRFGISQAFNKNVDKTSLEFIDGELIGYFVGDGWVGKPSQHHKKMIGIVYTEEDRYYSRLFRNKYKELNDGRELKYERDRGSLYEIRTENFNLVKYFESFGFDKDKYRVPSRCFTDFNFCMGFLSGLFQADGSVYFSDKQKYFNLTTVSEKLVSDVKNLLKNWLGIKTNLFKSNSKGVKYGDNKISNHKTRYDLRVSHSEFLSRLYKNLSFQERKLKKLKVSIENTPQKDLSNRISYVVKSVEETEDFADMYCASVPFYNSLVINGLLSSNCSEQYLNRDGLCILSSINCEMFSTNPKEYQKELVEIGESVNRFLDNVITYEIENKKYATELQRQSLINLRRTGAGYTNVAAWLFKQKLNYGEEEANSAIEDFTKWYNYGLYLSSIKLGKEKGSFEVFNREKFIKSPFIQRMMEAFPDLKFNHMRNVTCSSIAPTGTLSLLFRRSVMSYGLEPAFGMYFWKRTRISGEYKYYFCVPRVVREVFKQKGYEIPMNSDTLEDTWDGVNGQPIVEFIEKNKDKIGVSFKPATEVSAFDKLNLMSKVSKWVDSSISITYMLPEDSDWKDVRNFILEAWKKEVKSIAAFPDKKMYGIVSYIPFKELAFKLKSEGVELYYKANFTEEELKELNYSEESIELNTKQSPKRPETLDCDIHVAMAKGEKYIIVVGLLNGEPYEVFGGKANGFGIKQKCKGTITKKKKGQYGLEFGSIEIDDFSKHFTPQEQTIFRLASTSLRHGVPIEFVVEQMQKSTDDMFSLPSAVSRVLKKYIKDGQKVHGRKCPECGSTNLIYQDGCVTCLDCGWSKCE